MIKFILIFLVLSFNISCSKDSVKKSVINEKSLDLQVLEAYEEGLKSLETGDVLFAAKKFNEAEILFPQSDWAPKSALMAAYSYYLQDYYEDAIAELLRFIKVYPNYKNLDYAYYLLANSYYEQIVDEKKDLQSILDAKKTSGEYTGTPGGNTGDPGGNFANMTTYDCDLFNGRENCISVGGRVTESSGKDTSIVLVAGQKINENLRIISEVPNEWHYFVSGQKEPTTILTNKVVNANIKEESSSSIMELSDQSSIKEKPLVKNKISPKKRHPCFLGYVCYVADDNSHGFIYEINNLNSFNPRGIKGNYQIQKGCRKIKKGDIAIFRPSLYNNVEFVSFYLKGVLTKNNKDNFFTDFTTFNKNKIINIYETFPDNSLGKNIQLDIILTHPRNRLIYNFTRPSELEKESIEKINSQFQEIITKQRITSYDISIINWCRDFKPEFIDQESTKFEECFKNDKSLTEEITFIDLFSKWNLIKPEWISIDKLYHKRHALEVFLLWTKNILSDDFFNNSLMEVIFDAFEKENSTQILSQRIKGLLDDKKLFLEKSIKEIQPEDDLQISTYFNILNWIDTETSQSLREQMYFSSNKELQVKLYFENSVIYIPELNNDEVDEYFHKTSKLLINKPIDFTIDFIGKWELISPELIQYKNLTNYVAIKTSW